MPKLPSKLLPGFVAMVLTSLTLQGFSEENSSETASEQSRLKPALRFSPRRTPHQTGHPEELTEQRDESDDVADTQSVPTYAQTRSKKPKDPRQKDPATSRPHILEVKGGYFFFTDSKLRKVYDSGGYDVQLSGSFTVWKWLQIYGSVEYLSCDGKLKGTHSKTSIWEVPISLGLKPVAVISPRVQYYAAIGPRYFFMHQHNHSTGLDKTIKENGWGGFVNTGFNFFPTRNFVIDIFGEYSYLPVHVHPHTANAHGRHLSVGGVVLGIGLGYAF